jgi:hypothetical protein
MGMGWVGFFKFVPLKKPAPLTIGRGLVGRGRGTLKNTHRLPLPLTSDNPRLPTAFWAITVVDQTFVTSVRIHMSETMLTYIIEHWH